MDNSKYLIDRSEKENFDKKYFSMFDNKWYPDFSYKNDYKVYYILEDNQRRTTLDSTSKKKSYYFEWGIFISEMKKLVDFSNIYIKSADFTSKSGFSEYILEMQEVEQLVVRKQFHQLIMSTCNFAMENGAIIYSDSELWSVFYGECLYCDVKKEFTDREFDIFTVKYGYEDKFINILKKSIPLGELIISQGESIFRKGNEINNRISKVDVKQIDNTQLQ